MRILTGNTLNLLITFDNCHESKIVANPNCKELYKISLHVTYFVGQNQNSVESLNQLLWNLIPKRKYHSLKRVTTAAVAMAVFHRWVCELGRIVIKSEVMHVCATCLKSFPIKDNFTRQSSTCLAKQREERGEEEKADEKKRNAGACSDVCSVTLYAGNYEVTYRGFYIFK